ncbi:MAG TPA: J domain-containing protein [Capsulimonadaceae bacterium]|nr:J domain-containing protein [Capsulimonadaceae bacterium]
MGLPDRIYRMAKAHLDQALSRWDQIDSRAQQELDDAVQSPALTAWERAQAKINAAQAAKEFTPIQPGAPDTVPLAERLPVQPPPCPAPAETTPSMGARRPSDSMVQAAYTIIGVPAGSDFATVQGAYLRLKERASPERFPAGSADQAQAKNIERRINAAYMTLMDALSPSEDRFDRLEF